MISYTDLLANFVARLTAFRERHNAETAEARRLLGDTKPPPAPAAWAASIMEAGCRHLTSGQHLRPVLVTPVSSRRRYRDIAAHRLPPPDCGRGWSDVCEAAAGQGTRLCSDVLTRIVAGWMDANGSDLPDLPWQIACELSGDPVPREYDARWRLRTGDGKVYDALPWREAARMADADGSLASCSLAREATLDAMRRRLARGVSP